MASIGLLDNTRSLGGVRQALSACVILSRVPRQNQPTEPAARIVAKDRLTALLLAPRVRIVDGSGSRLRAY